MEWAVVTIRNETCRDVKAREQLLNCVWGPSRFEKTAERLREDRSPAAGLSLIAEQDGKVVGTVRLWHVCAGPGRPALLLGPLAVDEGCGNRGKDRRAPVTGTVRAATFARLRTESRQSPRRIDQRDRPFGTEASLQYARRRVG